jgi:hypothetical protein
MNQCPKGPYFIVSLKIAKQEKNNGHRKQLYKKERNWCNMNEKIHCVHLHKAWVTALLSHVKQNGRKDLHIRTGATRDTR